MSNMFLCPLAMRRALASLGIALLLCVCQSSAVPASASFVPNTYNVANVHRLVAEAPPPQLVNFNMKRQGQGGPTSPTVTVSVEPSTPSNKQDGLPETFFYPLHNQTFTFNFTCTIKHPSFRYKMTIVREQKVGDKTNTLDILGVGDYEINPKLADDSRYSVEFSEPNWLDPTGVAKYVRLSVLIKRIMLKDNGIYRCSYSNITKHKEIVIYKALHSNNLEFITKSSNASLPTPANNLPLQLTLGAPTQFQCRVNDIYPKPNVTVSIGDQQISTDQHLKDITLNRNQAEFAGFNILANVTYVPRYQDNGKDVNCRGSLNLNAANTNVVKSQRLNITGHQAIDESCLDIQQADKLDVDNFKVSCRFFANPYKGAGWQVQILPVAPAAPADASVAVKTAAPNVPVSYQDMVPSQMPNYKLHETRHLGGNIYEATFTIHKVKNEDLKNYKLNIFNNDNKTKATSKVITLHTKETYKSYKENDPNSATSLHQTQLHSRVFSLLMLVPTIAFILFYSR